MKKYLFLVFISIPLISFSQTAPLGNWIQYLGSKSINKKFNLHHEIQYRNYNTIGDLEQLLLRTGIGYNLGENNHNLLLGYGYILSQNYLENTAEKENVNEHRIFEQFITKQQIGRVSLQHRYRLEQRIIANDFKSRFRYFLGLNIPLNHKKMEDNTLYLSAYNEIFINTGNKPFDRNRLYGGLGFRPNPIVRFELGYLNQMLTGKKRDQLNIVAFVNF